ncbi:MAG: phosphoribosyl-AMP cyclohydrolase [Pseudomonadota bacterium]
MSSKDVNLSLPWLEAIRWNEQGLISVIAQEKDTGTVLMLAWMNKEALHKTVQTGEAVYFSRSRQKLWHKGELSGHTQKVHDIFLDCDGDAILIHVEQLGGIACHTGRHHCFFHKLEHTASENRWEAVYPILKDPKTFYPG